MGLWEDFTRPFQQAAEGVSHHFNRVRAEFERGDIGKALSYSMPVKTLSSSIEIGKKVVTGDLEGAKNRAVGQALNQSNMPAQFLNSSSSLKDAAYSDQGNNLTLGWSRDAADSTDRINTMQSGKQADATDISAIGRYGVRSAVYGAAIAYGASSVTSYVKAHPLQSALAARALSEGRYGDVAGNISNSYFPGTGNLIRDYINGPLAPNVSRGPAGDFSGGDAFPGYYSNPSSAFGDSRLQIAAAVFIGLLGIILFRRFK